MGSMARGQTMYPADGHATYLTPDASTIVMVSLDKKTKLAYWKVCHRFTDYCHLNGVVVSLPVPVNLLLNFLTSLLNSGYQLSVIASHVSVIAFIHKIQ